LKININIKTTCFGHEWPKHVALILILIFKNIHTLYHMSCVIDYRPT